MICACVIVIMIFVGCLLAEVRFREINRRLDNIAKSLDRIQGALENMDWSQTDD